MKPNQNIRPFRHSVPAILDDRLKKQWDQLELFGVTPQTEKNKPKYGGLYLDQLINVKSEPGNKPVFNVAHPNLYLVMDNSKTILITHGHYFEQYWALTSALARKIAEDDLQIGDLEVEELVSINFPLVQLACTGIGQSGKLNPVINKVQKDVKSGELKVVKKYISRLKHVIDKEYLKYEWYHDWRKILNVKEKFYDKLLDYLEEKLIGIIQKIAEKEGARYNEKFEYEPDVKERMGDFYLASLLEIDKINEKKQKTPKLPVPETIIFGHTHHPRPWKNNKQLPRLPLKETGLKVVKLMNCGGWLEDENGKFRGANIFQYTSGKPIKTINVE